MRSTRLALVAASFFGAALVAALCFRFWPRTVPRGQQPLARLSSLEPFRRTFNDAKDRTRVVALLSPTCGVCIAGASALENVLERVGAAKPVAAFVVWMPVLRTDIAPPSSAKLALVQ